MTCVHIFDWAAGPCQTCGEPIDRLHMLRDDATKETRLVGACCCDMHKQREHLAEGAIAPIAKDAKQEVMF